MCTSIDPVTFAEVVPQCWCLLPAWLRWAIHRNRSSNSPWWLSDIQEVLHLRNGCLCCSAPWICNSLSVTLTYPPPFCRSSNNRVQGDLFHVNWLLLQDDRGKGRAGIYQRGKPLPRREHQIQLGTEVLALVQGCVWRGQKLTSAPVIHQESKAQPLHHQLWLVHISYSDDIFLFDLFKETLNTPH